MLALRHLYFGYNQNIFEDINLKLGDMGFVCIHGKSGCGKTTLLKLIIGEVVPREGEIIYNNQKINLLNKDDYLFNHVSYIDQYGTFFSNMSIKQHFEFYGKIHNISVCNDEIHKWLNMVNLINIDIKKSPAYLSTGERKRMMIALAIMTNKEMLILDEPTASLDEKNKDILINLLVSLSKKILIICTSHDNKIIEQADISCKILEKKIILEQKELIVNEKNSLVNQKPCKINYFYVKQSINF